MMNRDNVETVFTQHLQNRSDFVIEHRYIARNDVFLRAGECVPSIQSHARIDDGAMLFHAQVITAYRDFVPRQFAPGRASAYISRAMVLYRPERSSPTV